MTQQYDDNSFSCVFFGQSVAHSVQVRKTRKLWKLEIVSKVLSYIISCKSRPVFQILRVILDAGRRESEGMCQITKWPKTHTHTRARLLRYPSLQPTVINIGLSCFYCVMSSVRQIQLSAPGFKMKCVFVISCLCAKPKPAIIPYHLYFRLTEKPKLRLSDTSHTSSHFTAPWTLLYD